MKEEKYLESKSLSIVYFIYLVLMYAVIYMTKNMFSSAMAAIVEEGFMTKSQTGFINAVFWFVYAVFQCVGGFAADKYSSNRLIIIGLSGAIISNLVIYFDQSYSVILVVWSFNAAIQFGVWPSVFKIISTQLEPSFRGTAVFWMLFSTSVGLGISMLIASFVTLWQNNFLVSVVSLLVMLVLFMFLQPFFDKRMTVKEIEVTSTVQEQKHPMLPLLFSSGLIVFMIICFFRVSVDNGIKMITPVMLMESYKQLPAALSTRLSSILVIFSAIGTLIAGAVQQKITRCEVKAQMIFYLLCIIPLFLATFIGKVHYIVVLVALSVAIMFVHGASPFSQSFVALNFRKYGRIGTVSGILNATASVGNIVASYVFLKMSEHMPWKDVVMSLVILIAFCIGLCTIILPRWIRFKKIM